MAKENLTFKNLAYSTSGRIQKISHGTLSKSCYLNNRVLICYECVLFICRSSSHLFQRDQQEYYES